MKLYGATDQTNKGECLLDLIIGFVYTKKNPLQIPYLGESKTFKITKQSKTMVEQFMKTHDIRYEVVHIVPEILDSKNLNEVLKDEHLKILRKHKFDVFKIDSYLGDPKKILDDMRTEYPLCEYQIRHKMDCDDTLVGLASIVSKIEKIEMYDKFKLLYGDVGSGNLNDLKTKNYIRKNWPNVRGLRKKWSLSNVF